jgi:hypothetical protein
MVDGWVVERPRGGHRFFKTQHFGLVVKTWLNGDRAGPLGERGDSWLGRSGSGYVVNRHLQGCSPRLCRLRTVRFAPVTKYWTYQSHISDMGPVNIVACCWWMLGFLHCFIGWLGRETGYGPADRSVGVLWIVSEALFLGSSDYVQLCWWLMKGCHVRGLPAWSVRRAYMDWGGKRTCLVGRVSPAGCTSIQIVMTLGHE